MLRNPPLLTPHFNIRKAKDTTQRHIKFTVGEMEAPCVRLTSLPQEVFTQMTESLSRQEILKLMLVCKDAYIMTESALYRSVSIKDKTTLTKLSRVLASKPYLCRAVRQYRVTGEAPWWCLDMLDSFPCLECFVFRPLFSATAPPEYTTHMMKKIAAGEWIPPTLKRCRSCTSETP